MTQYLEFVTDRLLVELNLEKEFNVSNPFDFMESISMEGKTNFFEFRPTQYQNSNVLNEGNQDIFDDENEEVDDFDERKILDELTGTHSIGSQNEAIGKDTEEDESDAAPAKKKAVKKRVAKKGVAKKIVKRPSANISSSEPEVNMGKGIKSINCPSCDKIHNVDENTTKFICSCGRRIRV